MRRPTPLLLAIALVVLAPTSGVAEPTVGGFTSDNVEYVRFVPFEVGTATGARIVDRFMYVTSWRSLSIYDLRVPEDPQLVSQVFFGEALGDDAFQFESEDVATNGRILIMSETLPRNVLHVWDVRDKAHPVEIAAVSSDTEFESANHTMSCLFDCTWLWGSDGAIVDLRNPGDPKVIQRNWMEGLPGEDGHDVEEVKPGFVLTSTDPWMYLDARDPVHPRLLAVGPDVGFVHSALWPRGARDRFAFTVGENNFTPRCELNEAFFRSWDTRRWRRTHTFQEVDRLELSNGTYQDGNPAVNGLGCSTHWFEENPTYANGGIVAMAAYEHGTRFLRIGRDGAIGEVGWFVPYAGSTSAPHWATDRIVYAIDYTRGLDVLRFTGEL